MGNDHTAQNAYDLGASALIPQKKTKKLSNAPVLIIVQCNLSWFGGADETNSLSFSGSGM